MKKLVKLMCPNCKANLEFDEERDKYFCEYCGTKLLLDNDNEHIYRHIDEAEIKRTEAEKEIKLKELEIEEKNKSNEKSIVEFKIKISLILGIIGTLFMIIGFMFDSLYYLPLIGMLLLSIIIPLWVKPNNR